MNDERFETFTDDLGNEWYDREQVDAEIERLSRAVQLGEAHPRILVENARLRAALKRIHDGIIRLIEAADRMAHGSMMPQETWEQLITYCRSLIQSEETVCKHRNVEVGTSSLRKWCEDCGAEVEPTSNYEPPADHCEKHGLHRAFAGGCPQCYHEKHDLSRTSEKAAAEPTPAAPEDDSKTFLRNNLP